MGRPRKHSPEEVVTKLRQAEVMVAQGTTVAEAVRSVGTTEQSYYRWRKEYGRLKLDQVKRMKALEAMVMLAKGQVCAVSANDMPAQRIFVAGLFGLAV